jgi:hypothetical protein
MHKVSVIIDVVIAFFMIICIIYNMIMGIRNHDAYYLILGILDYIFLTLSIKNIEDYIDNTDNV